MVLLLIAVACGDGGTGPGEQRITIEVADGTAQLGLPGATLEFPLRARVRDANRGTAAADIAVRWRVVAGSGSSVSALEAESDGNGIASATLRLGPDTGTYRVEASASNQSGNPATFEARAILRPAIDAVTPSRVTAPATVTIAGRNFSPTTDENIVLIDGRRGRTLSASATQLTVEPPSCLLEREAELVVTRGAVASPPFPITTTASVTTPLSLAPGERRTFTDTGALACIALTGAPATSAFLVVTQNAIDTIGLPMRYELNAIRGAQAPITRPARLGTRTSSAAITFETALRAREHALGPFAPWPQGDAAQAAQAVPAVGERRSFNVLTRDNTGDRVNAEVRLVTQRAIIYVDVNAPANGFSLADLQRFGALFDDPIYATDVAVFGAPTDIDQNDRVIIVFTPAVNALTERSAQGFIAGYFYGCDLLPAARCEATNQGEIFYGVVPDPQGVHSAPRSKDTVLRTVPGVLAHEFMHMIHYGRKNALDVLWLAEGLAHAAEDLVGDVLLQRGDLTSANDFQRPNWVRAQFYLEETPFTTLVTRATPGSLEERGVAWLFIKYLTGHYGGNTLLNRLTGSASSGAVNITNATGRPWRGLLADFAIALWADGSTEVSSLDLEPELEFADFDLRATLARLQGGYPLQPLRTTFQDLLLVDELASGAQDYAIFDAGSAPSPFNLAFTGVRGGAFAAATLPQLTILRLR